VTDREEFLNLAHRLADVAGEVQRRYFRTPVAVDNKADNSPVTIADREAEAAMRDLIRAAFPSHGVFGEEYGKDGADAEFVWVLDPIDGTKSFITGRPMFGTLIALAHGGKPVVGIIDQTITRERWVGVAGQPSSHNGRPISTRACSRLADAVMCSTSPLMFAPGEERTAFERAVASVRLPMFGGDCYAYGLMAMGFADLVLEAGLEPYDYMAVIPVIEGAGGRITGWHGEPLPMIASHVRMLAAGDARTHAEAVELLAAMP
jgi:inositol-phosphate phosphatase/L-galactose 1-phosphate phosphatase/histidinol-phosphatase